MTFIPVLKELVVLFGAAVTVIGVSRRLRLPPGVGLLLTGMAVGPSGPGWIAHSGTSRPSPRSASCCCLEGRASDPSP